MLRALALGGLLVASCGGNGEQGGAQQAEPVVLRVSATAGIGDLSTPLAVEYGSNAAALDLVYDAVTTYATIQSRDSAVVRLRMKGESPLSSAEVAAAVRYEGLVIARAVDEEHVEAQFETDVLAEAFERSAQFTGAATGPFRVVRGTSNPVVLERRGPGAKDRIEIHSVSKDEEWRLLLGRRIDVVPRAEQSQRSRITDVKSIRVLDLPSQMDWALYFNPGRSSFESAAVRRAFAHAIDRQSLASVVCGAASCASSFDISPSSAALPSGSFELIVIADESVSRLAADVLRKQLRSLGIELVVNPQPIDELQRRFAAGDFDLLLGPIPRGQARYAAYLEMNTYRSVEFRDAVADERWQAADRLLATDAPVTPLYEMRMFAAVDAKWCGDVTPRADSWRWIADLRPCKKGERP